jgi:methylisocitrate lyase
MVIFPVSAMRVAIKAIYELFTEIRRSGTQQQSLKRMFTRDQLYDLIDYHEMLDLEKQFSGDAHKEM